MYLVSDDYGDFKEIINFKELKEMLIDEIVEDTRNNYQEYEILDMNVKQLGKIAKDNDMSIDYIIENLNSYGWHVLNIFDIQDEVNSLREYVARKSADTKVFDDILKYIDEELK